MKHYVYMIYSEKAKIIYKGYSLNPIERLRQHNNNESKFTSNKGEWKLIFVQEFETKTQALKREKQLKRANSDYLKWCIEQPFNIVSNFVEK